VQNTAVGSKALFSSQSGPRNTAIGHNALRDLETGFANTAVGAFSLAFSVGGNSNTAVGLNTLRSTNGEENTAVGKDALANSTGGSFNTGIGSETLGSNSGGTYNTALGANANVSSGNLTNATALGANAIVNASNKVRIGNSGVTVIEGQVAYSFPSDARFKYNIQPNVPGLDFIKKLQPVTYYFDEQKLAEYNKTGIINTSPIKPATFSNEKQLHTGFLAQDVEKLAKELGYSFDGVHVPVNDKDHYSLAYSQFIMPLVKAVQEQQEIIQNQQKQIDELKAIVTQILKNK
jgi:hypothetical protein